MSNKVVQWLNGELSKEEASQWQKGFILRLLSSLKRLVVMAGFGASGGARAVFDAATDIPGGVDACRGR